MSKRITILLVVAVFTALFAGCSDDKKSGPDGGVDGGFPAGQFADPNLEACVRTALNIPDADLTAENLAGIINLECQDMGITNIAGIEHCTSLVSLSLWENEIVDISSLAGLTTLTSLQMGNNLIADLNPLSTLTNLTSLGLSVNGISDLTPLTALASLLWLNLDANLIVDASPLTELTDLTWLTVERNKISNLSPLDGLVAGGCNVYMEYQNYTSGDYWESPISRIVHADTHSNAKQVTITGMEEGRLNLVVTADNELKMEYEIGDATYRIYPEFGGKLVSRDNLIVLEGRSEGPVTVGEMNSEGWSLCSDAHADTCSLHIGMKTGTRAPGFSISGVSDQPVFSAAMTIKRTAETNPTSTSPHAFDTAFGAINTEMLPFVLASPNQYDAGSCLFMATTGVAEILMNQHTPLDDIQYLGDTDLSERFLMNAINFVPAFEMLWDFTDLIYTYNYLGGSMLDRDYPMATDLNGGYIEVAYSWTNDLPDDWEDQLVETPGFERTTIFIDPAKNENSQWNVGLMDDTTVEQIKYELRTKNAPVIIVYNHYLYWHADIIVGYDDTVETNGCPMVESMLTYFAQEGADGYVTKVEDHMDDIGECTNLGIFYVRDSIYDGEGEELTYNYGGPHPYSAKYSKRIIERTYNWVKFLANHAHAIYRK